MQQRHKNMEVDSGRSELKESIMKAHDELTTKLYDNLKSQCDNSDINFYAWASEMLCNGKDVSDNALRTMIIPRLFSLLVAKEPSHEELNPPNVSAGRVSNYLFITDLNNEYKSYTRETDAKKMADRLAQLSQQESKNEKLKSIFIDEMVKQSHSATSANSHSIYDIFVSYKNEDGVARLCRQDFIPFFDQLIETYKKDQDADTLKKDVCEFLGLTSEDIDSDIFKGQILPEFILQLMGEKEVDQSVFESVQDKEYFYDDNDHFGYIPRFR